MTKWGLQIRLLIIVMFSSIVIVGTLVTYGVSNYRELVYQAQQQKIESIIRTIDAQVNTEKDLKEMDRFRKIFSYLMEYDSELLQINLIVPIHGKYYILASNDTRQIGKPVQDEELDVIRTGKTRMIEKPQSKYIEITAPIHVGSNSIAAMGFYLDKSKQSQMLHQVTIRMIFLGLIGTVLLMIFLSLFIKTFVLKPLKHLGEIISRVANSDLSYRVAIDDSAELSQLGKAFNQMADRLLQRYQQGIIDQSTGLYNYLFIKDRLVEEIKMVKEDHRIAIMLVDFHEVFNMLRLSGENVAGILKEISEVAKENLPDNYICGRYSNCELAIIGPTLKGDDIHLLAEEFLEKVSNRLIRKNIEGLREWFNIYGFIKVGIAITSKNDTDVEELLLKAEFALEAAGIEGLNSIHLYDDVVNLEKWELPVQVNDKYISKRNLKILQALGEIINRKKVIGRSHSKGVAKYAVSIGVAIGLPQDELENIISAALLHDIGQICNYQLEDLSEVGAGLVARVGGKPEVVEIINNINKPYQNINMPLGARIIAVADKFEHFLMESVPLTPQRVEGALKYLQDSKGKELDPELVDIFLELIEVENIKVTEVLV